MCASSCLRCWTPARWNKHGLSPWRSCASDFTPPKQSCFSTSQRPLGRFPGRPDGAGPSPTPRPPWPRRRGGRGQRRRGQTPRKRPARAGHGRPRSGAALGSGKRSPGARPEPGRGAQESPRRVSQLGGREPRASILAAGGCAGAAPGLPPPRPSSAQAAPSAPSGGEASWGRPDFFPVLRGFGLDHRPGRVPSGPDKMEAPELN